MAIDWVHIAELLGTGIFVAGASYAAIRADLRAIHERVERCETDIRAINTFLLNKGH